MTDHPETPVVAEFREGDAILGFFALKRCSLRESDGSFRLEVELADRTGSVDGIIWDNARALRDEFGKGDVVKVQGYVGTYRDRLQVRVDRIRKAAEDEYDRTTFIPASPVPVEELEKRLDRLVAGITDPDLARLAELIFTNERFRTEYITAPGGKNWHHPYIGGLLEHSVGVTELCDFIARAHPELNRDLLVMGGLLHDVGKIREYAVSTVIDYSDEGRLEGHIVIGERFVRSMCDRVDSFPEKLRMLLSHLVLSHQGRKEFSTPVEPMIPEAFALYYADELDSKLNALRRIRSDTAESGESWSEYVRLLNRYIFIDTHQTAGDDDDGAAD